MDEDWTPQAGDAVVVVGGPFEAFEGVVERVNEETGKIRVQISFFGRNIPVELNRSQIKKLDQE